LRRGGFRSIAFLGLLRGFRLAFAGVGGLLGLGRFLDQLHERHVG
jgi:hypothetical protein